jgi:predicted MPP superfamily phosphohydrolase
LALIPRFWFLALRDSTTRIVTDRFDLYYDNHFPLPLTDTASFICPICMVGNTEKTPNTCLKRFLKAKPQIIVITGDLIESNGRLDSVISQLKSLLEIAPVYLCDRQPRMGNK